MPPAFAGVVSTEAAEQSVLNTLQQCLFTSAVTVNPRSVMQTLQRCLRESGGYFVGYHVLLATVPELVQGGSPWAHLYRRTLEVHVPTSGYVALAEFLVDTIGATPVGLRVYPSHSEHQRYEGVLHTLNDAIYTEVFHLPRSGYVRVTVRNGQRGRIAPKMDVDMLEVWYDGNKVLRSKRAAKAISDRVATHVPEVTAALLRGDEWGAARIVLFQQMGIPAVAASCPLTLSKTLDANVNKNIALTAVSPQVVLGALVRMWELCMTDHLTKYLAIERALPAKRILETIHQVRTEIFSGLRLSTTGPGELLSLLDRVYRAYARVAGDMQGARSREEFHLSLDADIPQQMQSTHTTLVNYYQSDRTDPTSLPIPTRLGIMEVRVKLLISVHGGPSAALLHRARLRPLAADSELMRELLNQDADPNHADPQTGLSIFALYFSTLAQKHMLGPRLLDGDDISDDVGHMLWLKADVNARDRRGVTPLMHAVDALAVVLRPDAPQIYSARDFQRDELGNVVIRQLVSAKARPQDTDHQHRTALDRALLDSGAARTLRLLTSTAEDRHGMCAASWLDDKKCVEDHFAGTADECLNEPRVLAYRATEGQPKRCYGAESLTRWLDERARYGDPPRDMFDNRPFVDANGVARPLASFMFEKDTRDVVDPTLRRSRRIDAAQ